MTLVENF